MSIMRVNDLKHWLNSLYNYTKQIFESIKLYLSVFSYLKMEIETKTLNF
jgi:hypothetical protein